MPFSLPPSQLKVRILPTSALTTNTAPTTSRPSMPSGNKTQTNQRVPSHKRETFSVLLPPSLDVKRRQVSVEALISTSASQVPLAQDSNMLPRMTQDKES